MHWKLKTLAFWGIVACPFGDRLYDFAQKHVTKRYARDYNPATSGRLFLENIALIKQYVPDVSGKHYFEFGAGRDLYSNIVNYCAGIDHQLVVDITPLVRRELINGVIAAMQQHNHPSFIRKPEQFLGEDCIGDLERFYGIVYRAPADAREVSQAPGSIDIIATTDTLEHIPAGDLPAIMKECYRLCHAHSVVVMQVDYSDHFAHTDSSITPYNFLQYGSRQWRLFNPPRHYQNRLRHSDYVTLFTDAGFAILSENAYTPEGAAHSIANVSTAKEFGAYTKDDLVKTRGLFVLGKR